MILVKFYSFDLQLQRRIYNPYCILKVKTKFERDCIVKFEKPSFKLLSSLMAKKIIVKNLP